MARGIKTGGRKRGEPNHITAKAKDIIVDIVDGNIEKAKEKLEMIVDPKEWLIIYIKLCEFVIPKQQAVNMTAKTVVSDLRSELAEMAKED